MEVPSPRLVPAGSAALAAAIVRTKIVATIGPASREEPAIRGLVDGGVDVFRLNMAHGSIDEHQETLDRIRRVSDEVGRPIGVLVDLAGPKIRLGALPGGAVDCVEGMELSFIRGTESDQPDQFVTSYPPLVDELAVGDSVMLADGTISLTVTEKKADAVRCRVIQGGVVRSRQGVNLPGVKLSVAAMSAADWQHAEWAAASGADFVSLSFVRSPVEVTLLKELLRTRGSAARVVAKIEKREAIENLEQIIEAADAVMVARATWGLRLTSPACRWCKSGSSGSASSSKNRSLLLRRCSIACSTRDGRPGLRQPTWPMPSLMGPTPACFPARPPSASILGRLLR